MNFKAHYQALVEFLLPYQEIWRNEIMLQYPQPVAAYKRSWIEALKSRLGPDETLKLSLGQGWDSLPPDLAEFHRQLLSLTTFPQATHDLSLPVRPQSWLRIIPKKRHELERLAPLVASLARGKRIVDIGGGQGHLAQTLAHHYHLDVLSVDMDQQLQITGAEWQSIKWKDSPFNVKFKQHMIERKDEAFSSMMNASTLTTGLHTCGPLAVAHLEAALMARATIVNLPCCYHKLENSDCNLSGLAQQSPLDWNQFALTMASGPHLKVTLEDAEFKIQIKRHRYALHFLLHDHSGIKHQVTLGNGSTELYAGPFASYARQQLHKLTLEINWSNEQLQSFFEISQPMIDEMLAAGIIRDALGRAIETILILDRALWLEEQNMQCEIVEVFDPKVSPRSLALVAKPATID